MAVDAVTGLALLSFNSKLVRLKAVRESPIKVDFWLFQFQTGSIKSTKETSNVYKTKRFQFQTGSIKRDMLASLANAGMFQFQTGSIKSPIILHNLTPKDKVSIPNWFD